MRSRGHLVGTIAAGLLVAAGAGCGSSAIGTSDAGTLDANTTPSVDTGPAVPKDGPGIEVSSPQDAAPTGTDVGLDAPPNAIDVASDVAPSTDVLQVADTATDTATDATATSDLSGEASTAACMQPAGIIGWWDADRVETTSARDLSPYANHGTIGGNAPLVEGKVGKAFQFGADTAQVEIPNAAVLTPTGAITLEAWVKPKRQSDSWWRIIGKQTDNDPTGCSYILGLSPDGSIYFGLFANGVQTYLTGDTPVPTDRWSHVAGVWDGTTMKAYVDGVLQSDTAPFSGPIALLPALPVRIGKGNETGYIFDGAIDEPTIYSRALSAAEVASIVSGGAAGKCKESAVRDQ